MSDGKKIVVSLKQIKDYQFRAEYGDTTPSIVTDEPEPLGNGMGPSPVQLLVTAVGNCLTDSLQFALRKFKQNAEPLTTHVEALVGRNTENRLRVLSIEASITLGVTGAEVEHIDRILGQFENFCTVTQTIAQSIPVKLTVQDAAGEVLHTSQTS
jgi:uncharacterized OsmC-like protein